MSAIPAAGPVLGASVARAQMAPSSRCGRNSEPITPLVSIHTETPNAVVPIPFKGIRISSATLNGQTPIWGPDPEKWTLLIKELQSCKLKVSTSVAISSPVETS
jgi:hypothetical protein